MQFHWGLTLPLWGWICKWNTNELKVFSLWELINRGAPLLHIYIFFSSQVRVLQSQITVLLQANYIEQVPHYPVANITHVYLPPSSIFSRVLEAEGYSRERRPGCTGEPELCATLVNRLIDEAEDADIWPSLGKGGQVHLLRAFLRETLFTTIIFWQYPAHWNQNGLQGQTKNKKHFTICEWCSLFLCLYLSLSGKLDKRKWILNGMNSFSLIVCCDASP